MAKTTSAIINEDLKAQLKSQGKNGKYYEDLVSDYVYYLSIKKKLKDDIKNKGLRYKTTNAAGKEIEKRNESIVELTKITATMLKILSDLKLTEPLISPPSEKEDKSKNTKNKKEEASDFDELL